MINQINTPNLLPTKLQAKDTKLSEREQKVYDFLKQGKKTVVQIAIELYLGDGRGYIRSLRKKGIVISDEWVNKNDTRFKQYWING